MNKILIIATMLFSINSFASGETLYVPSDSNATYVVIKLVKKGDLSILQTARKGSSGISFSSRLYSCSNRTYKYLADVDGDMDEFVRKNNIAMNSLNTSAMTYVTSGSVTYYGYKYACK